MLPFANDQLRVDLLDPVADRAHLGPRYCWGGYIWQVWDLAGPAPVPLVRGPEWPAAAPIPFNGQGLPESFRHRTLAGQPLTWRGEEGVALGAGALRIAADKTVGVVDPCVWQTVSGPAGIEFRTVHAAAGYSYTLRRTLSLAGRTLVSATELANTGSSRLALEWFAHPFFAVPADGACARLPAGSSIADNPGFAFTGLQLRERRRFARQDDGHMDTLQLPPAATLVADLPHPTHGCVRFATDFVPDRCIVWGNDRTFSLEPYLVLDLAPGASRTWSLRYTFGTA